MQTNQPSNNLTGITYEQVMATIHETSIIVKELSEQSVGMKKAITEFAEQSKESEKEFDKRISQFTEKTEKAIAKYVEQSKESEKEFDKRISQFTEKTEKAIAEYVEQSKETEKSVKEYIEQSKETEKVVKELARQTGELHNRFGELAEHLVAPGIARCFNELGYDFDLYSSGGVKIKDRETRRDIVQIDLLLENHETVAVVEIKTKPRTENVEEQIKRIQVYCRERQKRGEKQKKVIGAIAGVIFPSNVKTATLKAGLFVITQSGDTVKIDVPENFKPRMF